MKQYSRYIVPLLVVALVGFLIWYFQSIFIYIILSMIVALIGHPLMKVLGRIRIGRFRVKTGLSALITLLVFWSLVSLFFVLLIPLIISQAQEFSKINVNAMIESLAIPLGRVEEVVSRFHTAGDFSVEAFASEQLGALFDFAEISGAVGDFAGMVTDVLIAVFSISFISFFFLKDNQTARRAILAFVPEKSVDEWEKVLDSISRLLKRYFTGLIIEMFGVGILDTVGLTLLGIDFQTSVLIGTLAGAFNIIPYIGPIIGVVLGLIIGVAANIDLEFYSGLLPLIWGIGLVMIGTQLVDNIIFQPLIYSNSVYAHPLEIFLVILLAANVAGIAGMVFAIPVYTIFRVIAKEFFIGIRVVQQITKNM